MADETRYLVRFGAVCESDIDPDVAHRVDDALKSMPGMLALGRATVDRSSRHVSAAFSLDVAHGMGDAARDAARLARESLRMAGLETAKLTELVVELAVDDDQDGTAA